MKKFFTFCAAVLMACAVNAATINIDPGTSSLATAIGNANAGDVIVLANGTYVEPYSININKNVTIKAAENAHPLVQQSGYFSLYAENVRIEGIKFEFVGESGNGYCMYVRVGHKYLHLDGCEMTGFTQTCITSWDNFYMDSLIINNCYFHNNTKSVIYFRGNTDSGETVVAGEYQTCLKTVITNSTFANDDASPWYASIIDIRQGDKEELSIPELKVVIDRCTFYNEIVKNSDHAAIKTTGTNDCLVSNSIFALPASNGNIRAIYLAGGEVKNCLTFNYTKDPGHEGVRSGPARTNCIYATDPQLVDTANADFHLAVTMSTPSLRGGVDSKMLGAPRWWPTFYVRGNINGSNWDAVDDLKMTFDEENNYFVKTLELEAGTYEFKIDDGTWAGNWGSSAINTPSGENPINLSDASGNISLTSDGRAFTIYFSLAANKVWANYLCPIVSIAGTFPGAADWNTELHVLTDAANHLSASKTIHLAPGMYAFKVVLNHATWYTDQNAAASGSSDPAPEMNQGNSTGWAFTKTGDYQNTYLRITNEADYEFVYTYESKALSISGYPTSFTRTAANTNYQTLCVPFDATISNATAYKLKSIEANGITIESVATLDAGESYLIKPAEAGNMVISYIAEGDITGAPKAHSGENDLYGILGSDYHYIYAENSEWEVYVLQNDNKFYLIGTDADATIANTKAYLHIEGGSGAPIRIIENATNIENIEANEEAVKFFQNGQLFIKKNGVVYDMMGAVVK